MSAYFYDCGANTGQTFEWFLLPGDFARFHVVCFEPSPRNLTALAATCQTMRDRFASVCVVPAALGRPGLHRFYEGKTPMGDSLLEARSRANGLPIEVPTLSLAEYLRTHTTPEDEVVLKLDVEGAEADVLEDVLDAGPLERLRRVLVEWHGADPRQSIVTNRFLAAGLPLERWPF
jgi:FkbM family methyltransferase